MTLVMQQVAFLVKMGKSGGGVCIFVVSGYLVSRSC